MSHIFISYSRNNLTFASKIVEALATNNLDAWIDWKKIPSGEDWEQEIYRGIEEADAFLFLISPDSVVSEMCNKEILYAVQNGKRILPVFISNAEVGKVNQSFRREQAGKEIARRNYLFCREQVDDFEAAIEKIRVTIHTDYQWLQYHTKLQLRALDWERTKDVSRLLRGKELQEAEQQLAAAGSEKDPQPTDLQRRFVGESRRAVEAEQEKRKGANRIIGVILSVVFTAMCVVVLGLIWSAVRTAQANAIAYAQETQAAEQASARATAQTNAEIQQSRATQKERIARAGDLAAKALDLQRSDPIASFLLSVEAFQLDDNLQTRTALYSNAQAYPQIVRILPGGGYGDLMAYSPDGKVIASTNQDTNAIKLWDVGTGQLIQSTDQNGKSIRALAFRPDGKMLASGSSTGLDLWTLSSGRMTRSMHVSDDSVYHLAFSPKGRFLVAGGEASAATLWDVTSGYKICSAVLVNAPVSLAFRPDGTLWASSDYDSIHLWDTSCKAIEFPAKYPPGSPVDLAFSPDGRTLAFSHAFNGESKVIFLDVPSGDVIRMLNVHYFVDRLAFQPNTAILAAGSRDGHITFWDTTTGKAVTAFVEQAQLFHGLSFSPDGTLLASAGDFRNIILWRLADAPSDRILQDTDTIAGVAFSPDGKTLVSGTMSGTITLWDLATGKAIHTLQEHPTNLAQFSFNADGSELTSLSDDGALTVWDLATWQPIRTESDRFQSIPTATPDGKYLLSMPGDGSISLLDAHNGNPYGQPMAGATNDVYRLAFSPDSQTMAIGGDSGSITLWNLGTTQPALTLSGHTGPVYRVAFSPDGTLLASGGEDKTIHLWDIDPRAWLANVCNRAGRNFTTSEWNQYFPNEPYRLTCPQWPAGE